ncbi:MAG: hypothetical protein GY864_12005 [Desulfobacterales bacterium]|nr:hypothetical protein [Desulfobacterales bacterium]
MEKTSKKFELLAIFSLLIILIFACSIPQINSNSAKNYALIDPTNPEIQFVPLDFSLMTSGLIDDHTSKYIVFEGYYSGIFQDPYFDYNGRKRVMKDMQSFYIRERKHSVNRIRVVYHDVQENDVRALVPLNRIRSRIKVFAYVLPSGQQVVLRNGKLSRSFDETVIWLIKIIITFDDGIHYRRR